MPSPNRRTAGLIDQGGGRLLGCLRRSRVGIQDASGKPAIDEQRELSRQLLRVVGTAASGQVSNPGPHNRLVLHGARVHFTAGVDFGGGVDEGAAVIVLLPACSNQRIEHADKLFAGVVAS